MPQVKPILVAVAAALLGSAGIVAASGAGRVESAPAAVVAPASSAQQQYVSAVDLGGNATNTITSTPVISQGYKIPLAISTYFSVPVTGVVQLHNSGWGYGEIYKLYEYAKLSGLTPQQIQSMRDEGKGWGEIAQVLGIKPGNGGDNLGGIISGRNVTTGTVSPAPANSKDKAPKSKPAKSNPPKNNAGQNNGGGHGNGGGNGGRGGKPGKKP